MIGVLANHVLGWPVGGFLGVDVFFVVSGYVITGVLRREYAASGRISLLGFYLRRARRILPLALLVIGVVVLAAAWLFSPQRAAEVRTDALWSALFLANWHFAAVGADYFAQSGPPSPLEHYWSLGVEEQFYLVWPAVVILARRVLAPVAATLVALGAAWAWWSATHEPVLAYYSSLTRVWELALGALVAVLPPMVGMRVPGRTRTVLAWLALVVVVASFVVVSPSWGLPAPGAVAATMATALVLCLGAGRGVLESETTPAAAAPAVAAAPAGDASPLEAVASVEAAAPDETAPDSRRTRRARREAALPWSAPTVLTNRVSGYVGNISYALYLWHLPFLVFLTDLVDPGAWPARLLVLGLTVLLAVVTHYLVELPLMAGQPRVSRRAVLASLGAATALVTAVTATAMAAPGVFTPTAPVLDPGSGAVAAPAPSPSSTSPTTPAPTTSAPTPTPGPTRTGALVVPLQSTAKPIQAGLRGALAASSWPSNPVPAYSDYKGLGPPSSYSPCQATTPSNPTMCTFGTTTGPEIDVYGDSLGIPLLAATVAAYGSTHKVRGLTKLACAVNGVDANFGQPDWAIPCVNHRRAVVAYVKKARPDTFLMIETYAWATKLNSKASGAAAAKEWLAADQAFVSSIRPYVKHIAIVGASMPGVPIVSCYRPGGSPSACVTGIPSWWQRIMDAETKVDGVAFIDTRHWYCADGRCPLFTTNGSYILKADYLHTAYPYARSLAPDLKAMLRYAGIPSRP